MRFRLTLQIDRKAFGTVLPLNYQYELSAFIYRAIAQADREYSFRLHEDGFRLHGRPFKLFTFSNLLIPKYTIDKEQGRIRIECDRIEWLVSFLPETSTGKFAFGLFSEQIFQIGDTKSTVQFRIERVELLPPPVFESSMSFKTLSPVCIPLKETDRRYAIYLSPDAPEVPDIVLKNLLNKYHTFYGKPYENAFDFAFEVTSRPKSKLIAIKTETPEASNIRGFMFDFRMKAPVELMRVMYDAGLGEKNSMGFGMVDVK